MPVTLTDIARELNVNPKIARRRLRDAGIKKPAAGWSFYPSRKKAIAKIVADTRDTSAWKARTEDNPTPAAA